jgi:hypothetical protein
VGDQHGKGYVSGEAAGRDGSGAMLKLLAFVYLIAEQVRH